MKKMHTTEEKLKYIEWVEKTMQCGKNQKNTAIKEKGRY